MTALREQDIATSPHARLGVLVDPDSAGEAGVAVFQARFTPAVPMQSGAIVAERFALYERVASGGTVDVYRARDLLTDHYDRYQSMVAFKVLSGKADGTALLGAAAQMRGLRHPHIERVLELHRFGDECAIVTEWLDGESLAAHFDRRGPMSPTELAPVLDGICAALQYAHEYGIVHGDIKPGNVFLCTDGRTKLVDFGYRHGATPLYASCEVLENLPPVPQDDVYSLACLIYRVTTGEWPFGEHTALEAEREGAHPSRPGALSRRQWSALRRGLAFRRAERLGSSRELIAPFTADRARPPRASLVILPLLFAAILGWEAWQPGIKSDDTMAIENIAASAALPPPTGVSAASVEPASGAAPASEAALPTPSNTAPLPTASRNANAAALPTIGFSTSRVVATPSARFINLPVWTSGQLRGPVRLSVSAVGGSARVNEDFIPPATRLTLRPGAPDGQVLVSFLAGARRRNAEDFRVILGVEDGYARLGRASVVVELMEK